MFALTGTQSIQTLCLILLGLGCVILFIWLASRIEYDIRIFEYGLLIKSFTRTLILPWERLERIGITPETGGSSITLTYDGTQEVMINRSQRKPPKQTSDDSVPFLTIGELYYAIGKASWVARFEIAQRRYRHGERVDFKQVQVSAEGFHSKRKTLPWDHVSALMTDEEYTMLGIMQVGKQRAWKVLDLLELANADILPSLIRSFHPHLVASESGDASDSPYK